MKPINLDATLRRLRNKITAYNADKPLGKQVRTQTAYTAERILRLIISQIRQGKLKNTRLETCNEALSVTLGTPERTIRRHIERLCEAGIFEKQGRASWFRYYLILEPSIIVLQTQLSELYEPLPEDGKPVANTPKTPVDNSENGGKTMFITQKPVENPEMVGQVGRVSDLVNEIAKNLKNRHLQFSKNLSSVKLADNSTSKKRTLLKKKELLELRKGIFVEKWLPSALRLGATTISIAENFREQVSRELTGAMLDWVQAIFGNNFRLRPAGQKKSPPGDPVGSWWPGFSAGQILHRISPFALQRVQMY
jgi:hypothetical protein